ncbi:MAG: histone deacetylase family protein [Deinococcota bacterium]|nr:histone deacetylase family protein [Deinococcota bacterium]
MITVYSPAHALHHGRGELLDGRFVPAVERPRRAEVILRHLQEAKLGEIREPHDFGLDSVRRVHDRSFLDFLASAFERWQGEGKEGDALPLNWPARLPHPVKPQSVEGQLGYYAFDAATPITAGSWQAALSAAHVALTAQRHIAGGAESAFALCRPPGHHAAQDLYGGYCFLNNAAIAAQAFADAGARVAILDVDYHHGNGTQAIFYRRNEVLFVSLHADPAHDFPYFWGHAAERGDGAGEGFNLNLPLPLGTSWQPYAEALRLALARVEAFSPDVLVVSLGLDTFENDPISSFRLATGDYLKLGRTLAGLHVPTLFVMEGGYALEALGENVVNVLTGFVS